MNIWLVEKGRKKLIEFFVSGRQKAHWPTSKSMQAFPFLVTLADLHQVNDETVPPENHGNV